MGCRLISTQKSQNQCTIQPCVQDIEVATTIAFARHDRRLQWPRTNLVTSGIILLSTYKLCSSLILQCNYNSATIFPTIQDYGFPRTRMLRLMHNNQHAIKFIAQRKCHGSHQRKHHGHMRFFTFCCVYVYCDLLLLEFLAFPSLYLGGASPVFT